MFDSMEGFLRSQNNLVVLLIDVDPTWAQKTQAEGEIGGKNRRGANGHIHNIGFPFQLQGDPSITCTEDDYTLLCDENNRTVLNLPSGNYYVQSINYKATHP
ncbi:hypothetical protein RHMOL_Rhmol03G0226900 [Rhododendron molle]|uniref:Uncharacterized protein n=1 Tax=Rhododendron molle TaxID=49168 RepID=A0ACC0PIL8_RHOML|nr:hypothetical protein RHMOL_Rhmol03G0226900 [Rhododendron molle]